MPDPNSPPPKSVGLEAKNLFLRYLAADDQPSRDHLLSRAEGEVGEELRRLLDARQTGKVIDQAFEVTGVDELPEPDVTQEDGSRESTSKANTTNPSAHPGSRIGNYKLLEQIGEGGMGVVFMAQQTEPIRRRVAIKVIKPGMDSRQVVARFEAERQALALMDHPNIARVFDGGSTPQGYPYFVMELVNGIPLNDFCRQKNLGIREKLNLFTSLCRGVHHAHQKGVIHRDLKPSNVLVTLHDGRPVVKIIDFGIAKAMHTELTDKTLFTQFAAMIGTPLYMSPEQAELSGLDVDTRSDVYSLGVLLYEQLTECTPFDRETLKRKGISEIRQMFRDTEPMRPSQRIGTWNSKVHDTLTSQQIREYKKVKSALSGELDWIAMKALEKDRDRRYQSAAALAEDVQRYLDGNAVEACPPSTAYRIRKIATKHRRLFTTSIFVLFTAMFGAAACLWYAKQAHDSEQKAITSAEQARDNLVLATDAVDQLLTRVADSDLRNNPASTRVAADILQDAITFYDRLENRAEDSERVSLRRADALRAYGNFLNALERRDEAMKASNRAIADLESLWESNPENREIGEKLFRNLIFSNLESTANPASPAKHAQFERAIEVAKELQIPQSGRRDLMVKYSIAMEWSCKSLASVEALPRLLQVEEQFEARGMRPNAELFLAICVDFLNTGRYQQAKEYHSKGVSIVLEHADKAARSDWPTGNLYGLMMNLGKAAHIAVWIAPDSLMECSRQFFELGNRITESNPHRIRYRERFESHAYGVFRGLSQSDNPNGASEWLESLASTIPAELLIPMRMHLARVDSNEEKLTALYGLLTNGDVNFDLVQGEKGINRYVAFPLAMNEFKIVTDEQLSRLARAIHRLAKTRTYNQNFLNTTALVLVRNRQHKEAIEILEDLYARGREVPEDWVIHAMAAYHLGDLEIAEKYLEKTRLAIPKASDSSRDDLQKLYSEAEHLVLSAVE